MNKKHEYLAQEEHYEAKGVNKGRSDKTCEHCGHVIPKGTPHDMHTFYPEFSAYAVHKECHDEFMESLLTPEESKRQSDLQEAEYKRQAYLNSPEYKLQQARKIIYDTN